MRFSALMALFGLSLVAADAPFKWNGSVAAGQKIEIKGVNGDVRAERATGGQVEVSALRTGRNQDPNEVRIEVVPHGEGVTICAVYPGEDNRCAPGKEGKMNVRNNDVKVEFTVKVPAGVNFEGKTVNGDVVAKNLSGDVQAKTVNGDVVVSATGVASGSTVNGNVEISMDSTPRGNLNFSTVNGTVSVVMPGSLSANFAASTVNGTITLDHPLSIQGTVTARKISGKMGGGGPELKMSTVNGDIKLRKTGGSI